MAPQNAKEVHTSVLLGEILALFPEDLPGTLVDATLGMGGHSEALLRKCKAVDIIGIDQDPEALEFSQSRLKAFDSRIQFVHSNFEYLKNEVADLNRSQIVGVIADLGVSSLQLDSQARGFSFRSDAPLDMRMNPDDSIETAAAILATRSEEEIANIIYQYGEERASRKIARWIVEKKNLGEPITTTKELAGLVARALGGKKNEKTHPATRTFQALRIAVNRETEVLDQFIEDSIELLQPDGVLAMITFHSLEDRIVKRAFLKFAGRCQCPPKLPVCLCGAQKMVNIITKKPIVPCEEEIETNSRSRSAKLRAVRKIG